VKERATLKNINRKQKKILFKMKQKAGSEKDEEY